MVYYRKTVGLIAALVVTASWPLLAQGTAGAPQPDNELSAAEKADGWKLLFDGKSLDGWKATGNKDAGWTVEDGAIKCLVKGGGNIYTEEQPTDFDLRLDFKVARRTNSGIFVRWPDLANDLTGMEIQILDSFGRTPPNNHDCGAIYDILAPRKDVTRPAGEWNHMEIICWGPIVRVTLNGEQIIEADLTQWAQAHKNPDGSPNKFAQAYNTMTHGGHIAMQDHHGVVWYKNIAIKLLPEWQSPVGG